MDGALWRLLSMHGSGLIGEAITHIFTLSQGLAHGGEDIGREVQPRRRQGLFDLMGVAQGALQEALALLLRKGLMAFEPALKGMAVFAFEIKNFHDRSILGQSVWRSINSIL